MRNRAVVLALVLTVSVGLMSASTIPKITLADGYDERNRVLAPVYDGAAITVEFSVTAQVSPSAKFVRRMGGRLPATRGPEYDLATTVNLGALFSDALRDETLAMGLGRPNAVKPSWRVVAILKDAYLESRQVYMGATLFYGFLDVELTVSGPDGAGKAVRLRQHTYSGGYNAGMGRRDEAEDAAAHLLVEGAQEVIARLNREFFKAAASAPMSGKLAALKGSDLSRKFGDIRALGLSGHQAAVAALLGLLADQDDENVRSEIVNALGLLGSAEAVDTLSRRYPSEDEDVRWYTLKAMDYIGGDAASRTISVGGLNDKDSAAKRLAARIVGQR
jgi:hypothetical protein